MTQNYMELLVDDIIKSVKNNYNLKCDTQIEDAKSIALNNLPPKYFLSSISDGEKKAFLLDRQRRISVLAKVIEAMEIVVTNAS